MAMKGKGGASVGIWSVYEDFKPSSEWQQDAHSHDLVVSLPGFTKEQLRVSTEGRNVIRVRGERLLADNRWSRFLEDFEVPENSNMDLVRAKFHEGALTITIPKKTVDKLDEFIHDKKGVETHQGEKRGQAHDDRSKETSSSEQKQKQTAMERADAEKVNTVMKEEGKSERSNEIGADEKHELTGKTKMKRDDGAAAKTKDKEGKRKEVTESSRAKHGGLTKAIKGVAGLNEERQLMVNMGAAVLVIVAFSAYVTMLNLQSVSSKETQVLATLILPQRRQ